MPAGIYDPEYAKTDFRAHPEKYLVGRGEQGVLMVEPYKSEILPHWRFKTPEIAKKSADKIYRMFLKYKHVGDFVGMDMARKFLQMGYTRARRYANHPTGRKYAEEKVTPQAADWSTSDKAESARIFQERWKLAREDAEYLALKKAHQKRSAKS